MKTLSLDATREYHNKCNGNKPDTTAITPSDKNADAKTAFEFLHNYSHFETRDNDALPVKCARISGFKTRRAHNGYALNIGSKRICETVAKKNGTYSTAINGEYFRRAKLDTIITDASAKANGGYYVIERNDRDAHNELLTTIYNAMIENNVATA